jgi:hypothetical protein
MVIKETTAEAWDTAAMEKKTTGAEKNSDKRTQRV